MKHVFTVFSFFLSILAFAGNGNNYQAPRAQTAPTIDGNGNDACWSSATWYDVSYLWLGVQPSAADFTGKFKVTWNANKLFILAEITDDVLNDNYANPLSNYWEDDTWEIFLDENHSGGEHENNYNAFAYHVSTLGDIVDSDLGSPRLFNAHATVSRTKSGTTYTWEAAFDVYTDAYIYANGTSNPKATLTLGKQMGFAMAYCDNDGGTTRQSFIGSEDVPGTNKNVAYQNATVFGNLELVETLTPTFSQILVNNTGLTNPTVMTMLPDGRILIGQQAGTVKVVKNGALLSGNALAITVDASGGDYTERGLIGITSDPNFAANGYIYIFYTTSVGGTHNKVSRFKMTGDVIDPASETLVTDLDPLSTASNHNGGALHFGLDGKLYIATGENATPANAQNLTVTHGKLLRLNADGTIPSDNPYATDANLSKRKIWQYGLRNPFTFDIQPETGKLFINDVGQDAWEEINDGTVANKNFGWPNVEGVTTITTYANPVYTYNHGASNVNGCAITGGCFFNPASTNYPSKYIGKYFFMDYCGEWMDVMDPVTGLKTERFIDNVIGSYPVAVDVAADGNLYYLTRSPAALYKVVYSGSSIPDILQNPASQTVAASQPATFKVSAAGVKPFTYRWQKNGVDIPGAVDSTFKIAAVAAGDAGAYRVIITNTYGSDTSSAATLTVTAFNSKPTVTFTTAPANNSLFVGGQVFNFVATATDVQDGLLPASAFSWHFDLHHNTHIHDGLPSNGVKNFTATIPTTGHTDTDIYYKIYVVVKDAGGLTDTAFVNLLPTLKKITLKTVPAGLTVKLDDEPVVTPNTQQSVVGVVRTLDVVLTQSYQGKVYSFTGWSHGGTANQSYATAGKDTSFTALFQETQVIKDSISPIHDAFAQYTSYDGTNANIAYGASTPNDLVVKNYSATPNRQSYLMFNLNNLLGSATDISSVKLKLYGGLSNEVGANSIKVIAYEGASNLWTENAVTWNTKPERLNVKYDSVTVTNLSPADQFFYLDLTALIKAKVAAGQNLVTVVLVTPNDNAKRVIFQSKENPAAKGPMLVVSYAANCNAAITSPGTVYCTGSSLTLSANSGSGFTYKWYKDAVLIPGATAATYPVATNGAYTVQVTNASGCFKTSSAVLITQATPPTITITSPKTALCTGDSILITANPATGLTYAWYNNNTVIAGATTNSYKAKAAGVYTVEAQNTSACKKVSTPITITENTLPTAVITNSASALCTGDSITLTATAGNASYQWYKNAAAVSGATQSTYKVKTAGSYTVEVSNAAACKKLSAAVSITENALPVISVAAPVFGICTGDSTTLTATPATGLTYKWFKNSALISGASANIYKVKTGGSYYVEATNTNGCKKNATAVTITENPLPTVAVTSTATSFCTNGTVTLTSSNGQTYKWMLANTPIANATASTLVTGTAGSYTVEISNTYGCKKTSAPVVLTENSLPVAEVTVPSTSFCSGSTLELTSSTGASYQWYNSNGIIAGATTATYLASTGGPYYVEVTSSQNCKKTSEPKSLTVVNSVTWYADTDGDGMGVAGETISSCTQPNGYVSVAGDLCPADANKTEPGTCGCGIAEGTCIPTDVTGVLSQQAFVLFPNPVTQTILYFSKEISGNVYDAKGALVLSFNEAERIETSTLENGLYIIHTATGDNYKFYIAR
jgi:glucose/arabinose dehydrogenase